jgi:pimeloyl-ACP methyl ester carboxylesterase
MIQGRAGGTVRCPGGRGLRSWGRDSDRAFGPDTMDRPPLLLFNGIGANLSNSPNHSCGRWRDLRRSTSRRVPASESSLPAVHDRPMVCRDRCSTRLWEGGRRRRVMGRRICEAPPIWAISTDCWLWPGWTSLPWLRSLPQPTLVLMGRDDLLVPIINGQILARLIPGARLQIIDDGHLFFVTQPQATAPILERFLSNE